MFGRALSALRIRVQNTSSVCACRMRHLTRGILSAQVIKHTTQPVLSAWRQNKRTCTQLQKLNAPTTLSSTAHRNLLLISLPTSKPRSLHTPHSPPQQQIPMAVLQIQRRSSSPLAILSHISLTDPSFALLNTHWRYIRMTSIWPARFSAQVWKGDS